MFVWDRVPPKEWVEDISALGPPTDRRSHLALFWESGTPLEPVQRWALYECTPIALVPEWKLGAFYAELPCRCALPWIPDACPVCQGINSPGRARIFEYLQRTECLALPFWVIQGHHGGHKHRYNQTEEQWQKIMKRPTTPPAPGSLAYAPVDQRVIRRVRQLNRTWMAFRNLLEAHKHEQDVAQLAFRKALSQYVDEAVGQEFDALTMRQRAGLKDEVRTDFTQTSTPFDLDRANEAFLKGA